MAANGGSLVAARPSAARRAVARRPRAGLARRGRLGRRARDDGGYRCRGDRPRSRITSAHGRRNTQRRRSILVRAAQIVVNGRRTSAARWAASVARRGSSDSGWPASDPQGRCTSTSSSCRRHPRCLLIRRSPRHHLSRPNLQTCQTWPRRWNRSSCPIYRNHRSRPSLQKRPSCQSHRRRRSHPSLRHASARKCARTAGNRAGT